MNVVGQLSSPPRHPEKNKGPDHDHDCDYVEYPTSH